MCSSDQMQKIPKHSPLIETRCETRVVAHAFLPSQTRERRRGWKRQKKWQRRSERCAVRAQSRWNDLLLTSLPFIVAHGTVPLWKKLLFEVTSTASQWQCAQKLPCERTAPRMCDFPPPKYPLLSLCGVASAKKVGAPSVTLHSWEDLLQRR